MIAAPPRALTFEPRPPAEAAAAAARAKRQPPGAASWRGATETEPTTAQGPAITLVGAATPAPSAPDGRADAGSAPFLAQLLGQRAAPHDVVNAGRGQTSFRTSPVERYEETQRWTRRVELLFAFEGLAAPIPA